MDGGVSLSEYALLLFYIIYYLWFLIFTTKNQVLHRVFLIYHRRRGEPSGLLRAVSLRLQEPDTYPHTAPAPTHTIVTGLTTIEYLFPLQLYTHSRHNPSSHPPTNHLTGPLPKPTHTASFHGHYF